MRQQSRGRRLFGIELQIKCRGSGHGRVAYTERRCGVSDIGWARRRCLECQLVAVSSHNKHRMGTQPFRKFGNRAEQAANHIVLLGNCHVPVVPAHDITRAGRIYYHCDIIVSPVEHLHNPLTVIPASNTRIPTYRVCNHVSTAHN